MNRAEVERLLAERHHHVSRTWKAAATWALERDAEATRLATEMESYRAELVERSEHLGQRAETAEAKINRALAYGLHDITCHTVNSYFGTCKCWRSILAEPGDPR